MSIKRSSWLLPATLFLSWAIVGGLPQVQAADAASKKGSGESKSCPVAWSSLKEKLGQAVGSTPGGSNNQMWAVVVNRDNIVCAVAFSGQDRHDQWLYSRQIAAAKASTANGLSLDGEPLSTAQLYPPTQPGGSLFSLWFGNPLDPGPAYKGPASKWGTSSDPMVGQRVHGTITFGGGLALAQGGNAIVGGIGISGDSSCRDDAVARKLRDLLGLKPAQDDSIGFGGPGQHPDC